LIIDLIDHHRTPRITDSKKQSDEGAALLAVRVYAIVSGHILSEHLTPEVSWF
jgi:hypothetical protein